MAKKPCDPLAKTITELAMVVGAEPDVKTLDDVTRELQKLLPEMNLTRAEVVRTIIEATTGFREAQTELQKKLGGLKREARTDLALRKKARELEQHVREMTRPARTDRKASPEAIKKLQAKVASLRKQIPKDTSSARARIEKQIKEIDRHIAAGTVPQKRTRPALPADLAELRRRRDEKRKQMMGADPAKRQRLIGEINALNEHLRNGTVPVRTRAKATVSSDIAALRAERDSLKKRVAAADPAVRARLQKRIDELDAHIKAGTMPTRRTRPATPADIAKLRDERDKLARNLRRISPAEIAKREARIKELEGHIAAGTLPKPKPKQGELPEQIAILNARRDAVLKELAKSEPALRERFTKQIEDLTNRLENGVQLPAEVKDPPEMSKELERLVYQRDRLRMRVRAEIEALKPITKLQKAGSLGVEGLNLQRSIMTAIDLSAVLSQGGFHFLSHPVRGVKAMVPMFRALASPAKAHAIEQEILNRPNAPLYARAGLYIAEEGAQLSAREEAFMTTLLDKIKANKVGKVAGWPVLASQRAYVTYLNVLRADSFDIMAENLTRNGQPTMDEAEQIANFVNASTGRGSLKATDKLNFEQSAPALSAVLFSARYMASRFQLVGLQPILKGTVSGEGSGRARLMIAGEYARFLTGLAVVLGLYALAGGELETDPRSSDFLKIRVGNTRLDPTAGLSQVTVFLSRIATGEIKRANGDIAPLLGSRRLYNDPSGEKVVTDFLRNKLAPLPAALWHLKVSGKGGDGKPTSLGREAARMLIPISFGDISDAMEEHGVPRGTALALLSLFGLRMQTYDNEVTKLTPREIRELNRKRDKQEKRVMDEMGRD